MIEMDVVSASPKKWLPRNPLSLGMKWKTQQLKYLTITVHAGHQDLSICTTPLTPVQRDFGIFNRPIDDLEKKKNFNVNRIFLNPLFAFSHAHHAQIEHYTIIYRYLNTISEGRGAGPAYMSVLSKRWSAIALELSFFTILPRVFSLLDKEWMSSAYSSESSSNMCAVWEKKGMYSRRTRFDEITRWRKWIWNCREISPRDQSLMLSCVWR